MSECVEFKLGNYRLIRPLGRGGFADVYLGEHIYLKTAAAIKVLQVQLHDEPTLHSFLNEARMIARLDHPHIVRVLDFGIENSTPFLVMSYAPHGTLRQRHPLTTKLPLPTILSYIKQMAAALQYAHDAKIIHRDIKPENMLIGQNDAILLSDFGLAILSQTTQSMEMRGLLYSVTEKAAGTTLYMAPEQFEGAPCLASDQYSLGVIVYEWLCGSPPFTGTDLQIATQHLQATPPSLVAQVDGLPIAVEQVVFKALSKKAADRFASVSDFAGALAEAYTSRPIFHEVITERLPQGEIPPLLPDKPLRQRRLPRAFWLLCILLMSIAMLLLLPRLNAYHYLQHTTKGPSREVTMTTPESWATIPAQEATATPDTTTPAVTPTAVYPVVLPTVTPISTAGTTPTPRASPSPPHHIFTPTPASTTTGRQDKMLVTNVSTLTPDTCIRSYRTYHCTITLSLKSSYNGRMYWYAYGAGVDALFNYAAGVLSPGQSLRVVIYIFHDCPQKGSLLFVGSGNHTASVLWRC